MKRSILNGTFHNLLTEVKFLIVKKRGHVLWSGVYNAQGKDLCTMQKLCKNDPKLNLDRSFIIILMPMVEICLDGGVGDLLP